jgi:hypothetical protein
MTPWTEQYIEHLVVGVPAQVAPPGGVDAPVMKTAKATVVMVTASSGTPAATAGSRPRCAWHAHRRTRTTPPETSH